MSITQSDINAAMRSYERAIDNASIASQDLLAVEEAYKVLVDENLSDVIDVNVVLVAIESVVAATGKNIGCQYELEKRTKVLDVSVKLFETVMK